MTELALNKQLPVASVKQGSYGTSYQTIVLHSSKRNMKNAISCLGSIQQYIGEIFTSNIFQSASNVKSVIDFTPITKS